MAIPKTLNPAMSIRDEAERMMRGYDRPDLDRLIEMNRELDEIWSERKQMKKS